jgi:hypothetical protein
MLLESLFLRIAYEGKTRGVFTSLRSCRNRTISSVFLISGIFSRKPWARRWVFTSMNWYLDIISWKERRVGSTSSREET